MKKTHKKVKKLTPEQKKKKAVELARKRARNQFKKKIYNIFSMANFHHLNSENRQFSIGLRNVEIDDIFIYNNIIVISEDTTTNGRDNIVAHLLNKKEMADQIQSNKEQFIKFLEQSFSDEIGCLLDYAISEIVIRFVYFSMNETMLSTEDRQRFAPWSIVEPNVLSYLHQSAVGIKKSVRYEMYRFLRLNEEDLNPSSSTGNGTKDVKVSIIYPQQSTGRSDGVRLVSFMLAAETLIRNGYVLRKDNWEESINLYQRLIDIKKIRDIRSFLYNKGECFYNNIIVALPDGITFSKENGQPIPIEDIVKFENCTMHIPNKWNSICIIDGQHRVFAHYEGDNTDAMEFRIAQLRKKLHLLVTGLIFPENMGQMERIKIQSEIFAEINSKSKPIPPDVLLHIEMLRYPLSDMSLARQVLGELNKTNLFYNYFEFSPLKPAKLKVASIIKFALRYLVSITPGDEKESLYTLWEEPKKNLIDKDDEIKRKYIQFCINYLTTYFSAIHQVYSNEWKDEQSKLLTVISFNSFILTLKKDIKLHGLHDREYYLNRFEKTHFDFSKENFPYTSSQYNKFSDEIIEKCFN